MTCDWNRPRASERALAVVARHMHTMDRAFFPLFERRSG